MAKKGAWKKWVGWVGGTLVALSLLGFGGYSAATRNAEQEIRDLARANHIAVTPAELFPVAAPSPDTNAFDHIDTLVSIDKSLNIDKKHPFDANPKRDPEEYRDLMPKFAPYFAELDKMVEIGKWTPHRTGDRLYAVLFPEMARVKLGAKRLVVRSQLRAKDSDLKGAADDVRKVMVLASFMNNEPSLIGGLVKIAIQVIGDKAAALLLVPASKDPDVESTLNQAFAVAGPFNFDTVFRGEASFSGTIGLYNYRQIEADMEMTADGSPPPLSIKSVGLEATRSYWGPYMMKAWITALDKIHAQPTDVNVAEAALKEMTDRVEKSHDPRLLVAEEIFPIFDQATRATLRVTVDRALFDIGLAALKSGQPPNVEGTTDPMSGKPFHFLRTESGWKVYSVGKNGMDDEGVVSNDSTSKDIVLTYDGKSVTLRGS